MKIVVVGGSGLIGSKLVTMLTRDGHEIVPASRRSGVDAVTGEGLLMLAEGVAAPSIEQASLQAGYPAAVLALMDELTLTLPRKIRLAYGDAWIPNYGFPDVMDKIVELRERADREIPVIAFGVPADPAKLAELEEAGVKRAVHWLPSTTRGPIERALDRFEDALAELRGET